MDSFLIDVRQAIRVLRNAPGFTLAIVAVLALGIGANTAIFSVVYGVLLKPLPFADSSRLVAINTLVRGQQDDTSYPDVADIRAQTTTMNAVAAYTGNGVTLTGTGEALNLSVAMVTADFFEALGVAPSRGRTLTASDDTAGAPLAAVIADSLWHERFGGDEHIVGRGITIDGKPFTVVGVMPATFEFPFDTDRMQAWLPMRSVKFTATLADQRGASFLRGLGRLRPGATVAQAQAELTTIAGHLAAQYAESNKDRTFTVVPLQQVLVADYRLGLIVVLAAVGAVLLIMCANVANLLLARGAARRKEIAVRAALGAGRGRLVRQLVTESLMLSVAGGAAGVLLALWGVSVIVAASPIQIPRLHAVHVDRAVLLFAVATSLLTGVVFGLVPALQMSRPRGGDALKDEGRGSTGSEGARTRQVLVVAEMTLSLVLLASAGLLVRSLIQLEQVNPGFVPERVVGMQLMLPDTNYPNSEARVAFANRLLGALRATPGVRSAAVSSVLPLSGNSVGVGFSVEGLPPEPHTRTAARLFSVTADYFSTMEIPVIRGRPFSERDAAAAPLVAIVSETMARQYWPNEDPIGRRLTINMNSSGPREIVGVVADVKGESLSDKPQPQLYAPLAQAPWPFMAPVVRAAADPSAIAGGLRSALARTDPSLAALELKTMDEYLARTVATPKFTAALTAGFAALALLLAALGLYGVTAYSVAQRRREIGIRMALGAQASDVLWLVVSQAFRMGALGVAIGIAAALATTRLLETLLFNVKANDPLTFAAVSTLLFGVLMTAAYLPARRATRVNPVIALRAD